MRFFVAYPDRSISAKPTVEIEFLQNGKSLTKLPMPLGDAGAMGRIQQVMTVPAAAIPAGVYHIRAAARQGDTQSVAETDVKIEAQWSRASAFQIAEGFFDLALRFGCGDR